MPASTLPHCQMPAAPSLASGPILCLIPCTTCTLLLHPLINSFPHCRTLYSTARPLSYFLSDSLPPCLPRLLASWFQQQKQLNQLGNKPVPWAGRHGSLTTTTTLPIDRKASRQEDFVFSQLLLVLKVHFLMGGTKETQTILLSLSDSPKSNPKALPGPLACQRRRCFRAQRTKCCCGAKPANTLIQHTNPSVLLQSSHASATYSGMVTWPLLIR